MYQESAEKLDADLSLFVYRLSGNKFMKHNAHEIIGNTPCLRELLIASFHNIQHYT